MSAPCRWRTHLWGGWYTLHITRIRPNGEQGSSYDTQERKCSRCGLEQRVRWWRR